ncbi:hypothetical protein MTR67_007891 [Solanum verrucosum]|uniref:Uncharacterized protein n=1 Tax=Solanum verrucosum TaxID=315347 RepID=A0AAF0Q0N5_SOLVR|nr:hypothetical protein MTR67_007891 [Solanum verrucosum]
MLDVCSQQTNHEVFVDEQSDATTFSSEGHSDLEDEILEQVCDVQAKFEGSVSPVQKTMVANDQGFVLEDFTPILGNIQLNVHVSIDGRLSKYASNSINHCSCLFTNSTLFLCPMSPDNAINLNLQLEPLLDILPFGSVVDAWVDNGQLCDSLSYVAETPHKFSTILERYPYVWNRSSQQLFDSMSQTCHYSKVSLKIPKERQLVTAIADKSLLFTLEFEEAFNLTFSIFRAYDHSTLAYHCIYKSKSTALISHTSSDAHDNVVTGTFCCSVCYGTGPHLARIESAKRMSKYGMLMKLVAVFEELVMIWCDNLQANHHRRFFSVLIVYDIVAAVTWALIAIDFKAHTCGNDSWTLSMIESELSIFSTEAKLVLSCMLALDLAWHSLEFGTRFNEESSAIMPPVGKNKSSLFSSNEFDFFLIIIDPITLGFFNVEICPITCWIKYLRLQSTDPDVECCIIQDVNVVILHNLATLEANWLIWLVDQMHRGIALAIGVSGQGFIWDANMGRDSNDNNMIFVLFYSNLEGKVLF